MNTPIVWREEAISRRHDGKKFDCGSIDVNRYLQRSARQNHESGGAKHSLRCLLFEATRILGYYAVSPDAIEFVKVSTTATRRLGRYEVPGFRLGRLAAARCAQGSGFAGELLLASGRKARSVYVEVGGVALAIDGRTKERLPRMDGLAHCGS